MLRVMCKSKIHRATVTGADLNYVGSITVDPEGRVVSARVLKGPGHGLDEAARDAILRFRFRPAIKGGEAVSTDMKYSYTFLLD